MSGRETIQKIREDERYKGVKIVFLTVAEFNGEEYKKEFESLDISAYIQKPFDTDEFSSRIQSLIEG